MLQTDDAPLVRAAQATRGAFAPLYQRYYPVVFAFVRRRVHDRMLAEDITAQTFLHALQGVHRYEERGVPFSAWLLRIAAHEIATHGRRSRRSAPEVANVDEESAVPPSAAAGPEQLVTERERAAWVKTHVDLLSVDQRRAIGLRYWGDCSIREVAVRLGRSEGATKILLHRTLKTLRARLQADTLLGSPAAASRHVA